MKWYWEIQPLDELLIFMANRIGGDKIGMKIRDQYIEDQLLVDGSDLPAKEKKILFRELHRAYNNLLKEISIRPDPKFMKLFRIKPIDWSTEKALRAYIEKLMSKVR